MRNKLHPVLSDSDLPAAELWAARMDGELFRLGDCFAPIDEVEQPGHRARAAYSALSGLTTHRERVIAEQRSAAWIWGALAEPPSRHQFCVATESRTGRDLPRLVSIREVVIADRDVVTLGEFKVTTALRTIVDLARFSGTFDVEDARTVSILMGRSGVTADMCLDEMDRRRNLPGKRRARERLSRC